MDLSRFLEHWAGRRRSPSCDRHPARRTRLRFDTLEERAIPATAAWGGKLGTDLAHLYQAYVAEGDAGATNIADDVAGLQMRGNSARVEVRAQGDAGGILAALGEHSFQFVAAVP